MCEVSLKKPVRPAIPPEYRGECRLAGKGLRQAGVLVVVVGLSLLTLAAGDALAGAELGGRGDDALRVVGGFDERRRFRDGCD